MSEPQFTTTDNHLIEYDPPRDPNVFHFYRFPFGACLRHPLRSVRHCCRRLKYAWQRATRGWCNLDVWCMSDHLLTVLPQMLRFLAKHGCSSPLDMSGDDWREWLYAQAKRMEFCGADSDELNPYWPKLRATLWDHTTLWDHMTDVDVEALRDGYRACAQSIQTRKEAVLKEAFDELADHFDDLCD